MGQRTYVLPREAVPARQRAGRDPVRPSSRHEVAPARDFIATPKTNPLTDTYLAGGLRRFACGECPGCSSRVRGATLAACAMRVGSWSALNERAEMQFPPSPLPREEALELDAPLDAAPASLLLLLASQRRERLPLLKTPPPPCSTPPRRSDPKNPPRVTSLLSDDTPLSQIRNMSASASARIRFD
jgi:hypothetical protein